MASDNTCPICSFHLVSTDAAKCPQCDADLTCFRVLDAIPDEAPSVVRRPFLGAVFLLLGGLASGFFLAQTYRSEPPPPVVLRTLPIGIKIPVKAPLHYGAMDPSAFDEPGFFP